MRTLTRTTIGGVAISAAGLWLAGNAAADPNVDPCSPGVSIVCVFAPVAPDLDHDVDLTQGPATVGGRPLPQTSNENILAGENVIPPSVCVNGCV